MSAVVWSLNELGRKLRIRVEFLKELARQAASLYRPYIKEKPGKKAREIANPCSRLKWVQREIYRTLLKTVDVPGHLHGGVGGRSPWTNALQHLGQAYVVRIDIKEFFPSITDRQVYDVWQKLGYGPKPASVLTALTTFRGRLPQGAPTSTALANLILLAPDSEIQKKAALCGCQFTRFVDDLGLSGDRPQDLIHIAVRVLTEAGFRISRKKLVVMPRSQLQELTGLGLNSRHGPSVPRHKRDRVRAAIHQLGNSALQGDTEKQVNSVKGRIQHIEKTNPGSALALRRQLLKQLS